MITTLIFDFGGVVTDSSNDAALYAFRQLGLQQPERWLDRYCQKGLFRQLEQGQVDDLRFVEQLSRLVGRPLSWSEVQRAWLAYMTDVPLYKLQALEQLRQRFRVVLLSNTNPFVMCWARSSDFGPQHRPLDSYFDRLYLSYQIGQCKPDPGIFQYVLEQEHLPAEQAVFIDDSLVNTQAAHALGLRVVCPQNNADWRMTLEKMLTEDALSSAR